MVDLDAIAARQKKALGCYMELSTDDGKVSFSCEDMRVLNCLVISDIPALIAEFSRLKTLADELADECDALTAELCEDEEVESVISIHYRCWCSGQISEDLDEDSEEDDSDED